MSPEPTPLPMFNAALARRPDTEIPVRYRLFWSPGTFGWPVATTIQFLRASSPEFFAGPPRLGVVPMAGDVHKEPVDPVVTRRAVGRLRGVVIGPKHPAGFYGLLFDSTEHVVHLRAAVERRVEGEAAPAFAPALRPTVDLRVDTRRLFVVLLAISPAPSPSD